MGELVSQHLVAHPFLKKLAVMNHAVMHGVCNQATEALSMARSDVAFSAGEMAKVMVVVTSGILDYIPMTEDGDERKVEPLHWCCEAVLWTKWTHQGQLQASIESTAMIIKAAAFRTVMQQNGFVLAFVRKYASSFCQRLTALLHAEGMPSDLHEIIAWDSLGMQEPQKTRSGKFIGIGRHSVFGSS